MNNVEYVDTLLSGLNNETEYITMETDAKTELPLSTNGIDINPINVQDLSKPYRITIRGDLVNGSGTYSE